MFRDCTRGAPAVVRPATPWWRPRRRLVLMRNGPAGNTRIATDAIQSASRSHHFLSVHKSGQVAIVDTEGNPDCHVILRGGKAPNYDAHSVAAACQDLVAAKLPASLMVDCSHANSSKQHEKQKDVASDIAAQIAGGSHSVFGVMIESHLQAGAQKFTAGKDLPSALEYGKSITDACLGWEDSLQSLAELAAAVQARRNQQQPQQLPATGKAAAGAAAATV